MNPPSIPGLGAIGGFEFYIQNRRGGSTRDLEGVVRQFTAKARERKELAVASVFETLQSYFESSYVAQFVEFGRIWQVIIQAEAGYRDDPEDLSQIFIRAGSGMMVPLSAVATARYVAGPGLLPRFNGFPAAKLTGNQAPGFSSGQAITAMESVAQEVLPEGYGFAWAGQAFEEKKAGGPRPWPLSSG